eukprot:TRINITY_DN347_c0_g3_i6.p2 TRINITY_DN347_c0_g3~~TRINITY_DN347_c0_g3_i6.p2  ORF type:complete len:304 (+),score=74.66 TRINITY_DN347_c0_g3_i6:1282-2193(+)
MLMQYQVLGCINDLFSNPEAVRQAKGWRSQQDAEVNAARLLIRLWNQEERRLGVRSSEGVIVDSKRPLETKRHKEAKKELCNYVEVQLESDDDAGTAPSTSHLNLHTSLDVPELTDKSLELVQAQDLRDKLFLVFCRLGFGDDNKLSLDEQSKLLLISQYETLREGEIWLDIRNELTLQGIKPVSNDTETIEQAIANCQGSIQQLRAQQIDLKEQQRQRDLEQERSVYEQILQHKLQKDREVSQLASRRKKDALFAISSVKAHSERKAMVRNSTVKVNALFDAQEEAELASRGVSGGSVNSTL